jgi:branched-chain amino acid transport system permease protein
MVAAATVAVIEARRAIAGRCPRDLVPIAIKFVLLPAALLAATRWLPLDSLGKPGQIALTLAIVVPLGPLMYRLVFEPLADASVLLLLIVAVAVDVALSGTGLLLFGSEGARTDPLIDFEAAFGPITIGGATAAVIAMTVLAMLALYLFFDRTLHGKALRATAFNRLGARLVGIRVRGAGRLAFLLASLLGGVSGVLISSIMTVYFDSGFMIGLKGFVAAIVGGLASYPAAVAGAVAIGLIESWSAFYASTFRDAIVFGALIPVLVARSLLAGDLPEDETIEE